MKGIYSYGYEKPSAIQQRAIRPIVLGRDVIAQSQSGTGKTAVFSISALQLLDDKTSSSRGGGIGGDVQVLVLSPTRELAEQTQRVIQSLGDYMNVSCFIIYYYYAPCNCNCVTMLLLFVSFVSVVSIKVKLVWYFDIVALKAAIN